VHDDALVAALYDAAEAVRRALGTLDDWGLAHTRPGQYRLDLVADEAAVAVLHRAGLGVLSEESGLSEPQRPILVVLDPVDGSTNASQGLPWFSTSLCALDADGPRAAVVVNQASGVRYEAVRGAGARHNGRSISPSSRTALGEAVVAINGLPDRHPGWAQFRALGSASLDLCAVADGVLDGYVTLGGHGLHGWDYLGALLVCTEAGVAVAERDGQDLVARDDRLLHPVAGATPELLEQLLALSVASRPAG